MATALPTAPAPIQTGTTQYANLPAALQQIYQQGWGTAAQQMGKAYTPYTNPRLADLTALQRQGAGIAGGLTQALNPLYAQAQQAITSAPTLTTGAWTDPGVASSYMSPYTAAVTDRLATLGNRNLTENLLPSINSTFTGAGQFGSTRNADFANRALRDTQEAILGQQAQALEAGYGTAGNLFGADQARALTAQQGNLGARQALGTNLTNLAGSMAGTMGNVARLQNQFGAQEQAFGQQNLDLAYQDFLRQQQYPMANTQSALGMVTPTAQTTGATSTTNTYQTPSTSTANNWLGGLAAAGQLYKNIWGS